MASMYQAAPLALEPRYSFGQSSSTAQSASSNIKQHSFYPYADNGGTTLGIAGADFAVIAGDTRSTSGYNINSRFVPKLYKIGSTNTDSDITTDEKDDAHIVLSVVGFAADGLALKEKLDTAVKLYRFHHGKPITTAACAQRLSHILYQKRFFPFYVQAILGGLDEEGRGAVYSYDPVGTLEREQCRAAGSAASLMMPFLDNQVNFKNQYVPGSGDGLTLQAVEAKPLARDHVEDLVKDAFANATERQIHVGDYLQMMVITKDGIQEIIHDLKKD